MMTHMAAVEKRQIVPTEAVHEQKLSYDYKTDRVSSSNYT